MTLPADVRAFYQVDHLRQDRRVREVDEGRQGRRRPQGPDPGHPRVPRGRSAGRGGGVRSPIKRRTFERYRTLVAKDYVSRQDYDTVRSQYDVAEATLRANPRAAGVQGDARALRRHGDGALRRSGRADPRGDRLDGQRAAAGRHRRPAPAARHDVRAAGRRRLRSRRRCGHHRRRSRPDLEIDARVSLFSRALDPRSRSMLCEVWLDNHYNLYPGTFVHATLHLDAPALPTVPSTALLLRNNKMALAVVRDNHVHIAPVKLGIDDGHTVQIAEGSTPARRWR